MLFLVTLFVLFLAASSVSAKPYRARSYVQPNPRLDLDGVPRILPDHDVSLLVPEGETRAREIAEQEGFVFVGQIVENYYKFRRPKNQTDTPHNLRDLGMHYQDLLPVRRVLRAHPVNADPVLISDRGYENQWHLHGRTQWSTYYPVNFDAPGAWTQRATGKGVRIAVVDDGLDYNHKDISPNYDAKCSHSFTKTGAASADPMPGSGDYHGTACAGLAGAAKDGSVCGVGMAYDATLCGLQLLPRGTMPTDADEAEALAYLTTGTHYISVKSNSWGPPDNGKTLGYVGPLTQRALYNFSTSGRNGLGGVIVWAGGNGAGTEKLDQSNLDGFCNSVHTICVAAVQNDGHVAYYSEPGFCILVTAPSSGGDVALYTSLVSTSNVACTNTMSGTSGACPQVAGLAALILQANPTLGERDVRAIMVQSAQERMDHEVTTARSLGNDESKNHPARAIKALGTSTSEEFGWIVNGANMSYSPLFGFGLPNASRAVQLATHWTNLPANSIYSISYAIPDSAKTIHPNDVGVFTVIVPMRDSLPVYNIEDVELDVSLDFGVGSGQMKDIDHISLTSPDNTMSTMLYRNRHTSKSLLWTFSSVAHRGEHPSGTWTVKIRNKGRDTTTVNHLSIHLHGHGRVD